MFAVGFEWFGTIWKGLEDLQGKSFPLSFVLPALLTISQELRVGLQQTSLQSLSTHHELQVTYWVCSKIPNIDGDIRRRSLGLCFGHQNFPCSYLHTKTSFPTGSKGKLLPLGVLEKARVVVYCSALIPACESTILAGDLCPTFWSRFLIISRLLLVGI